MSNISSMWSYNGTNNSGLAAQHKCSHNIPADFIWSSSDSFTGAGHFSDERRVHHGKRSNEDFGICNAPPTKILVTPDKVANQFGQMSLDRQLAHQVNAYETRSPPDNLNQMWQKYHTLEKQLEADDIDEVDEGVGLESDSDHLLESNSNSGGTLHVCSTLQSKLNEKPVPDILVPRSSSYQVMVWKPPQNLVETVAKDKDEEADNPYTSRTRTPSPRARTRRKANSLSALPETAPCLLKVPPVRANTPPPKASAAPISEDLDVNYCENDDSMDL